MYANGAKGYFDALSVHPYCYPAMPDDTTTGSWNTFQRLPLVHDVMAANGEAGKQIWLTEYGAPTGTGTDAVSETKQAEMLVAGLTTAAAWSWTGPLFYYGGRDRGTDLADREQNFGYVRSDFSSKPAHSALVAALSGTTTPPAVTPPSAPTSLSVTGLASTAATLNWKVKGNDTVKGYQVRIRRSGGSWQTFAKVISKNTSAGLTGLKSNTTYSAQVLVFNDAGSSAFSSTLTFKTPAARRSASAAQIASATPHGSVSGAAQSL